MKNKKIRTISNTGVRIIPFRKSNVFLELHKLDYEKQRLEDRISEQEIEQKFMKARVGVIKRTIGKTIADVKAANAPQGKSTNKLKY